MKSHLHRWLLNCQRRIAECFKTGSVFVYCDVLMSPTALVHYFTAVRGGAKFAAVVSMSFLGGQL